MDTVEKNSLLLSLSCPAWPHGLGLGPGTLPYQKRAHTACASGEGNGTPLQYSCLENPMDRGAWWAAVHGVARVGHDWATSLSVFAFMHWRRKWPPTRVLAWRVPETAELGRLLSLGSHRVGHDWSDLAAVAAAACARLIGLWEYPSLFQTECVLLCSA